MMKSIIEAAAMIRSTCSGAPSVREQPCRLHPGCRVGISRGTSGRPARDSFSDETAADCLARLRAAQSGRRIGWNAAVHHLRAAVALRHHRRSERESELSEVRGADREEARPGKPVFVAASLVDNRFELDLYLFSTVLFLVFWG